MFIRYTDPGTGESVQVALRKPIVSIGRAPGNDIVLTDPAVSPTHANLLKKPHHVTISVVQRGAEVYVNGRRARSADLTVGDKVLIGRYELHILDGEPSLDEPAEVGGRAALDGMGQLVGFSRKLMEEESPDRLFKLLLKAVVEVNEAEKGFVIFFKDGERHLAASHNVGKETLDLSRVSDSIIDRVVESRKPIIVSDAVQDSRFGQAKSVVDLRLSSVMCVPLLYRNDLLGVLYLGNDSVAHLFDNDQLELLTIFASQASMIVHHALMLNQLKVSNKNLRDQLRSASQGQMIGSCGAMKAVFKVLRRVAPTDISVLILGETGTGKELVARELHNLSERKGKPFISINCGAIPEHLLESELFGHKKGSFTGAVSDKIGKFGAADGGTLFLDEIGEMPMPLQVKLLRVLQERKIERVGETSGSPIDIRVVAATNNDLAREIDEGRFREDLFYRLNEVAIDLPPLRDRGEDIVQIGQYFLNRFATQYGSKVRGFTNQCTLAMKGYYWPGNVRQVENRIKKAVIMSDRALLQPDDLGLDQKDKRKVKPLARAEEEFKLSYIREVLELNNWNKAQTARDLDVDPRTIFRYIEKFDD
ncbi:MAG: GAF domain-containing protein [Proteobacteria bacterium]|nr:GAF domain-containing protein [Pseudomonadota bacterium]MCP4919114.1 GAF domain-containing protein [Pseudomonadota bacterium]